MGGFCSCCVNENIYSQDAQDKFPVIESDGPRSFYPKDQCIPKTASNSHYNVAKWTNFVRTSQYHWWNFIPLNLLSQVILPANLYFLFMAFLQLIPVISDSGGIPTFLLPIAIVMSVTMVKDAYEDIKRHRADKEENCAQCLLLNEDGKFSSNDWQHAKVGDIVKLEAGQQIPADVVLLSCADEYGISYIETAQLDGETNLKNKTAIPGVSKYFADENSVSQDIRVHINYGPPSAELYQFSGELEIKQNGKTEVYNASVAQFICRGAKLVNTQWALGLIVYNGHHTRIFMNVKPRKLKKSSLMKTYNSHAIFLASFQAVLCVFAGVYFASDTIVAGDGRWYLFPEDSVFNAALWFKAWGIAIGRWLLLLSYFIPITLFVQLEMVKLVQTFFMESDEKMFSRENNKKAMVKTSALVEELGCVTHVFSDKTGTLTSNVMQLKCLAIGQTLFGYGDEKDPLLQNTRSIGSPMEITGGDTATHQHHQQMHSNRKHPNQFVCFDCIKFHKNMQTMPSDQKKKARMFMLGLGLNHSVLAKKESEAEGSTFQMYKDIVVQENPEIRLVEGEEVTMERLRLSMWKYKSGISFDASSPDEFALVATAKHLGFEFVKRPDLNSVQMCLSNSQCQELLLMENDKEIFRKLYLEVDHSNLNQDQEKQIVPLPSVTFEVLEVLEFDNVRKRMSVVIRDRDGSILLLTKGADSSVMSATKSSQEEILCMENQLSDMSRSGLRTLVFAYRKLEKESFLKWQDTLRKLTMSTAADKEDQIIKLYDQFEVDLELCGCTGIDDKLQEDVGPTIAALKQGGMKVWVLTGDKLETAVAIGHSVNLLTDSTYNAVVDGKSPMEIEEQLKTNMAYIAAGKVVRDAFDIMVQTAETVFREEDAEGSDYENEKGDNKCCFGGCRGKPFVCCGAPESPSRNTKVRVGMVRPPTMNMDDFVRLLLLNARDDPRGSNTKAKAMQGEAPVTQQEIDEIVERYIKNFAKSKSGLKLDEKSDKPSTIKIGSSRHSSVSQEIPPSGTSYVDSSLSSAFNTTSYSSEPQQVEKYTSVALTVTGEALGVCLSHPSLLKLFYCLANLCSTVLACRVTPKQKAEVILSSAKYSKNMVSLAVGDGANDVSMITAANVGVGIAGKEGQQALRASDFAIGEFRFLRNLLLVHGHDNIRRNGLQVYHTVYKNVYFALCDWVYGFLTAFSATDLFNSWLKQLLNVLYMALPLLLYSTFDRLLPYEVLHKVPELYPIVAAPKGNMYYGRRWIVGWTAFALFCAIVSVVIPLYGMAAYSGWSTGQTSFDVPVTGQVIFHIIIYLGNLSLVPYINTWFWFTFLGFFLCFGAWILTWVVCPLLSLDFCTELEGSYVMTHTSPSFYFACIMSCYAPLAIMWWKWGAKVSFYPPPPTVIRERISKGVFDVVVATTGAQTTVVVPRISDDQQWRGFAFSEGKNTRFEAYRRLSQNQKDQ